MVKENAAFIVVLLFSHQVLSNSCDPMDCSLPDSSVHGISQARILEWVAISFFRGSAQPRDQTCVSCIGRWILYLWITRIVSAQRNSNFSFFSYGWVIFHCVCVCVCVCISILYAFICWGSFYSFLGSFYSYFPFYCLFLTMKVFSHRILNVFTLWQNYLEFKILVIYITLYKYRLHFGLRDFKLDRLYYFKRDLNASSHSIYRLYLKTMFI